MVGGVGDMVVPLAASSLLADNLEDATLLVVDHNGHGAYRPADEGMALHATTCTTEVVDRYLIDLELPPDGSICVDGDTELHPPEQP